MDKPQVIVIDGMKFYRENTGIGYYLGNVPIEGRKRKYPMRAHVYVWRKHYGDIPKGYEVHHIDEDPSNNDISNLMLLSRSTHGQLHGHENAETYRNTMLTKVIPAAAEWHRSEDAREWHKEHYEDVTRAIWNKPVTCVCENCGKEYTTVHAKSATSRFCSNKCKAAARRKSGVDNIEKICTKCGKTYIANKYQKTSFCLECSPQHKRRVQ